MRVITTIIALVSNMLMKMIRIDKIDKEIACNGGPIMNAGPIRGFGCSLCVNM